MSQTHFSRLDDESRALHDSWDHIARIVFLVGVLSILVWAVCTALREVVHFAVESLFHFVEHHGAWGALALMGALLGGGLIRGLLFRREGWRDVTGDGMDLALRNYHVTYDYEGDDPQPRYERPAFGLAAKKFVATVLTLGSGTSGGLEAPVVVIAEACSAGFARVLAVRSEYELRTYQLAGIAAAVATLLGAPFTAALFALEIAYGDRIIYRKLAYALWAGVIAFWLNTRLHGFQPLFTGPSHLPVYSVTEYAVAALVAVAVSVPVALGFGKAMAYVQDVVGRVVRPAWTAVATAGAAGAVALSLYYAAGIRPSHVLGTGEGTIEAIFAGGDELGVWWLLLLVLLGKMLTTGLTLGGGGSAGLLVPSMFLGGISGALTARLVNLTGWAELDPALFAVVGVGSSLVAVVGVPLAAIALVFEVFGKSYGPPAILACGVTYLLTLKIRIYRQQKNAARAADDETDRDPAASLISTDADAERSSREVSPPRQEASPPDDV